MLLKVIYNIAGLLSLDCTDIRLDRNVSNVKSHFRRGRALGAVTSASRVYVDVFLREILALNC